MDWSWFVWTWEEVQRFGSLVQSIAATIAIVAACYAGWRLLRRSRSDDQNHFIIQLPKTHTSPAPSELPPLAEAIARLQAMPVEPSASSDPAEKYHGLPAGSVVPLPPQRFVGREAELGGPFVPCCVIMAL
jgi:hypothetical protein